MAMLYIEGNRPLSGSVKIHGAKNSALPILAASFICYGETVLHNCPRLTDIDAALEILRTLGCRAQRSGSDVIIDSSGAANCAISPELMHKMRSSVIFLGAILAKCKKASIYMPGGCELGPRPIDIHLKALELLGAEVTDCCGKIDCECIKLCGCELDFPFPSVGATENIILAAVTADGQTVIHNAAREPEIADLCEYLNKCGAKLTGAGSSVITINGVHRLHGCEHSIIPDRIEAATYMAAAAITGSNITLESIIPEHIQPVLFAFREAGCTFDFADNSMTIYSPKRLNRVKMVRTLVYPGFPTDALSPFIAMMTVADGTSMFIETIFQDRFKQVGALCSMGANIKTEGRVAVVEGVCSLYSSCVTATDLRGGASLIIAALKADGVTKIDGLCHIDRGYEDIEGALNKLGARVIRKE